MKAERVSAEVWFAAAARFAGMVVGGFEVLRGKTERMLAVAVGLHSWWVNRSVNVSNFFCSETSSFSLYNVESMLQLCAQTDLISGKLTLRNICGQYLGNLHHSASRSI